MKIECKIIRQGGTKVDLDNIEYHFEPLEDGAHVAEVEREAHIDRFLSIADAYRVYHGKLDPKGSPSEIKNAVSNDRKDVRFNETSPISVLMGSSVHEASYTIGEVTYTLDDVVAKAHTASGLSVEEWNELEDEDRNAKIDIMLDELAEAADSDTDSDAERDELAEQYKAKFGKAPPANAKIETIKAKLAE